MLGDGFPCQLGNQTYTQALFSSRRGIAQLQKTAARDIRTARPQESQPPAKMSVNVEEDLTR
jgi:hypothetical protein